MVKDLETTNRRYAKKSLMTFLEGKKNLNWIILDNWIIGVIRSSGLIGGKLQKLFDELRDYGDNERHFLVHQKCKKEGIL